MIVFQTALSISSMVLQNCIHNKICKRDLPTSNHLYRFNILTFAVCSVLFGFVALSGGFSVFTVGMGVLFGVVTALSNYCKMQALADGPMHITLLLTTSSMLIPTLSGIFFGEHFSLPKLLFVGTLIFFIYLSLDKGSNTRVNMRWLLYCSLAFLSQGSIGVLQKIHQSSSHRGEAGAFLLVAFLCSLVYCYLCSRRKSFAELGFGKRHLVLALICGLCTFAMNYLNLKLSGLLPSQLFFPIVNGTAIVLSSAMSVVLFKEKLSKKQITGLSGGIASLIAICLVK